MSGLRAVLGAALLLAVAVGCGDAPHAAPPPAGVLMAYVANGGSNNVQVLDTTTGESLRKIYAGTTPWRLVPAPDGRSLWIQHWSARTTAVLDLDDHEIGTILPVRGPGIFDATGERFLSFSWPASDLAIYDARNRLSISPEPIESRASGVSRVYDFALADGEEDLFLVRYDPVAPAESERYSYLASLSWALERRAPVSVPTGLSPVDVLTVPGQPFILTADSGTDRLTLLNVHGDGRSVPACPGPRKLLLSEDSTRLVVLCWDPESRRRGFAVSFQTDFTARPWPLFTEDAAVELDAGPVAGALSPSGDGLWVVDQPGGRLLELDAASLDVRRELDVGEAPTDVVLVEIPRAWRDRLLDESPSRARARAVVSGLQNLGAPFRNLSWRETLQWSETANPEDAPPADATTRESPDSDAELHSRVLEMALTGSGHVRRRSEDGRVTLAAGGWSLTVRDDGRFWTTPRQELISRLYALPSLELDEALRLLAGDLPGSPYLAGGLAIDLVSEVEEEGRRYTVIGTLRPGRPVAQLWVDTDSGRPANLIEKFPMESGRGHEGAAIGGFVETRFQDFVTLENGVTLPSRLDRVLDGRWVQVVLLDDVEVDPPFEEEAFDLARLGGQVRLETEGPGGKPGATGAAVPILRAGYLAHPWQEHPGYSTRPPTSGPRSRRLAPWGIHALPVPDVLQVHNLEHGGVAVQYGCSPELSATCRELAGELTRLTAPYERVIVAPYPAMDARIALTAWGRMETLEEVDAERIVSFLEAWEGLDHHESGTTAAQ